MGYDDSNNLLILHPKEITGSAILKVAETFFEKLEEKEDCSFALNFEKNAKPIPKVKILKLNQIEGYYCQFYDFPNFNYLVEFTNISP